MKKGGTKMETRKISIHTWIIVALSVALAFALIWAGMSTKSANALGISNENNYNRAFHEMVGHVEQVNNLLSKAQLAKDDAQMAKLSSDIFRESTAAKACLGQLPTSQVQLDNTSKFLSQVGDYTYVLAQNMINGQEPSDEDYEHLQSMNEYAQSLTETLLEIESKIGSGEIKISDGSNRVKIRETEASAAGGGILEDLQNVEKSFEEYPSLIYDGPFSEHIENREPALLKNESDISQEEALNRAEAFLGDRGNGLIFTGLSENTQIPVYMFTKSTDDEQVSISITRKGGFVLSYITNRAVGEEQLDINAATEKAAAFLQENGFYSMQSSYFDKSGGVATINFAFVQDNITCYSDLVKVKVALDTGDIVGLESNGYVMNHTERELSAPKLTMEEARGFVSTRLEVSGTKMALVPKDSMREVLCYEFKGAFLGKNFLVYVNADNGREEEIFILLESEEGVLTV